MRGRQKYEFEIKCPMCQSSYLLVVWILFGGMVCAEGVD